MYAKITPKFNERRNFMHTNNFVTYTNDLCFKKVFSVKEILEDFINSFLKFMDIDESYEYSDIRFQSMIMPNSKNIKLYYGDIIITLSNGDIINLEMYKDKFTKRDFNKSLSYICRLYSNQLLKKEENYEDNKKVISLNLMKGNYSRNNGSLVNSYKLKKDYTNKIVEGTLEMYLVRFDLSKKVSYNLFNERFVKWLRLINSETIEEMREIAKGDQIMENSIRVVDEWNKTHVYTWDDYVREQTSRAEYVGREENTLEIAKNLLNIGISMKDIMQATGLSQEEIENLV